MIADLVCPSKQLVVHCQLIYQKIQKGISSARSDDTKSLKSVVVDWITPRDKPLNPPLSRCNVPIPATLGWRSRASNDVALTFRHRLRSPDASDGHAPSLPAVAHSRVPLSYVPRGRLVRRSI